MSKQPQEKPNPQERIDTLVNHFKRNAVDSFNRNVGNSLTEDLATGMYTKIINPVDELVKEIRDVLAE